MPPGAEDLGAEPRFGWTAAPSYALVFHLSPRFSTESSLVFYTAGVGLDITSPQLSAPIRTRADFEQFEYQGGLRFNLKTGAFQPYVKYGNGITWYQLKNVSVNGDLLTTPTSPKFRPKGGWRSLGFNETVLGAGFDWEGSSSAGRGWEPGPATPSSITRSDSSARRQWRTSISWPRCWQARPSRSLAPSAAGDGHLRVLSRTDRDRSP